MNWEDEGVDSPRRQFFAECLEKNLGDLSGKTVLDIGSGTGYSSVVFEKLGAAEYFGIEPSEKSVAISKNLYPKLQVTLGSLETVKLNRVFDVVVSIMVFEHIVDPETALKKINSLLTVNGFFFLIYSDIEVFSAPRFDITVEVEDLGNGEKVARTTYPFGVIYDILRPTENYAQYATSAGFKLVKQTPLYPTETFLQTAPRYEQFKEHAFVHLLVFQKV